MKKYTQEELNEILKNHLHWMKQDCENWENMKANLENADLRGADLSGIILDYAILKGADLKGTFLIGADLNKTNLRGADLNKASLSRANLNYATLIGVNLKHALLVETNLEHTTLIGANLNYANLIGTDLHYTNLYQANLNGANLTYAKNIPFISFACPDTGSFIGYKKAGKFIIKLEIPADAKRCSATGRKCRCNKAKVLSIQYIDEDIPCDRKEIASDHDKNFIYRVGETVEEPNFDENRWNECTKGIHFFINRQEAVEYGF